MNSDRKSLNSNDNSSSRPNQDVVDSLLSLLPLIETPVQLNGTTTPTVETTPEPAQPEPEKKIDVNTINDIVEFDKLYKAGKIDANQIEPFLNNHQDPGPYRNAIFSFQNIAYIAKTFPTHKALLIQPLLKHTDLLNQMIRSGKDLITLAKIFPEHKDAIITPFLNDVDMYNKIIRESAYTSNFTSLAKEFPDHVEALLSVPEKNPGKFCSSPITEYYDLKSALEAHRQHQASLLKTSLNTKVKVKKILKNAANLLDLAKLCPDHKELLIGFLLNDPEIIRELLNGYDNFFRGHKELVLVAEQFPEQKNKLFDALFSKGNRFTVETIFDKNPSNMNQVADTFPDYREVLSQPDFGLAFKTLYYMTHKDEEAQPAPVKTPKKNNTNSPKAPVTHGFFTSHDGSTAKSTVEIKRDQLLVDAINRAADEYVNWFDTGLSYRGPSGNLAWWNHRGNGRMAATQLKEDIKNATDTELSVLIKDVLKNSYFKNHSLGTFLLDQLLELENSPWAGQKYSGYVQKRPDESIVMNKTNTNTNG